MKVKEITGELQLRLFTGEAGLEREVSGAYVCDLLSDVMGFAREGEAWITLQSHLNVIAIASLKDMPAVFLVRGNEPEAAVVKKAEEEGIAVAGTNMSAFELAGRLYEILHRP
ncbi:MAG: serine kinase [Bacteroidota bacterium]